MIEEKNRENEQLWAIAKEVATTYTLYEDTWGHLYCIFCRGEEDLNSAEHKHTPECIVILARTLMQKRGGQK